MDFILFKKHLKKISEISNINFYLIGGIVRDNILKVNNIKDIDIVVEYDFDDFIKVFSSYFNKKPKKTSQFLTALFEFDDFSVDIITARKEIYERHGVLPKIIKSSIEDDILRRDFTINSIAYSIRNEKYIDILGGINDINNKIIRENRKELFIEDPTRIFRLFKYKNRFNFSIENKTYTDLQRSIKRKDLFINVSKSRISREWLLILQEEKYKEIINDLYREHVFELLFDQNINTNLNCEFTGLNNYEKTVLMFWNNDFGLLIHILDIFLNGIKKTQIKKIEKIKNYLQKNIKISDKLKIEYENIIKNIQT